MAHDLLLVVPVKRLVTLLALTTACAVNDGVPATLDPPPAVAPADPPVISALPPAPDARPATPDAGPVLVPGVGLRLAPPAPTACGGGAETPVLPEGDDGPADEMWKRAIDLDDSPGLDRGLVSRDDDPLALGVALAAPVPPLPVLTLVNSDHDCLSDVAEAAAGTNPKNPDSDGDGWFDGACNERRKLVLTRVWAHDEQEDLGDDELYLVADDVRHPNGDLDAVWDFDDGRILDTAWTLATRTRGVAGGRLALVHLEGWEDDFEIIADWSVDDLLFATDVNLGAFEPGATFTRRFTGDDDYDYELTFRVNVERFANPDPRVSGDRDGDGIHDADEARLARDLGGIADPGRKELFVEVNWMRGHPLRTEGKRMITTQLYRNGVQLALVRDEELPVNPCLTVPEARALYAAHFGRKGYGAFRYAVLGETIWNDRSGVAWGDLFLVNDDTWWINNWILPQAGTFIHELGHTLGLTSDVFRLIDSVAWFSYDSAMNYLYQATKVNYSHDGAGGGSNDHDDWAVINPAHALRFSFALTTSDERGVCD